MKTFVAGLVAASVLAPVAAFASPACTSEPKDKWMSEQAMQAKVAEMGYQKIKTFKVTGSCYEIYGYTKDNKKAEVYFNPVTGAVVKAEID
ncbi:PepSY domain-containing protein [Starkeya koreensis]|uniref:PepSY domain-containing protein n=1 Tax=Ancylobacter koreensis TaxID=266121 RepID=A0ABT0DLA7_9HYPH|nr:PepSY domain-containing protein [Ancylobacter koreensis]MCK0207984.1 PepSY domain-containing protein [Ancylobacter koreensis]